jgi:outer membrane lipoprotein-sorting protein
MKRLRTVSTRRLLVVAGAIVVLAITAGIAQGALSDSNPTPAAKPLDRAVLHAVNAPKVNGLTASITFSNNLIPAGSLPEGSTSPLLSGAKGRLWVTNDGRARLELQSDAGDAEIASDGKQVTVYDANSNTVYRFDVPQGQDKSGSDRADAHRPVTLDQVDKAINKISQHWSLSGANPTSTAGAPTYTVRISPRDDGGLLGAAELAWDANNGIPLRAAVYADNQSSPVLELKADDVSFGAVPDSDVNISPPKGARVVDMSSRQPEGHDRSGAPQKIEGVDAVQSKLDFKLVAPDSLAGLPRQNVRLVQHENQAGAVGVYGKGLGAIVVLQSKAGNGQNAPNPGGGGDREHSLRLPQVNINGATGTELATALGTVVTFERNGISYTVAGSVPPQAAEQAARELQ